MLSTRLIALAASKTTWSRTLRAISTTMNQAFYVLGVGYAAARASLKTITFVRRYRRSVKSKCRLKPVEEYELKGREALLAALAP